MNIQEQPISQEQVEIHRQHKQSQEKYVYYVIALSVSALGFTVYRTEHLILNYNQIPLGLAVLLWVLSVSYGLTYLRYFIKSLYDNGAWYDVRDGRSDLTGKNPAHIKIGLEALKGIIINDSKKANAYFNYMNSFFYGGVICFIIWHVLELYRNSQIN